MDVRQINNNSNTNSNSSLSREDIGGSHLSRDEQKSSLSREDLGGSGSRSKWMTADPTEYELLKENAKSNRKNMTEAESVFWSMVKGSALGQRCLRQHIIGDYIVDFLFRKSKLVVEIDGGYHFTDEQQEDDALRTDWLEHQGYIIIRFKNEQVLFDTNKVIEILKVSLSREI